MPVNNVLNVPTYKFVISKYLLFWRARPCQPLVVDKEYFGSPPPPPQPSSASDPQTMRRKLPRQKWTLAAAQWTD